MYSKNNKKSEGKPSEDGNMNAFLVSVGNISKNHQTTSKCNQGVFEKVTRRDTVFLLFLSLENCAICILLQKA